MIPKSNHNILFLFGFFLIVGCKSEPVEEFTEDFPLEQLVLADSLFGELSDKEQYYQHFLIEIPAVFQQNIDSLSDWIVNNQPGGIRFLDWEEDSIAVLKFGLDTLLSIQPLYSTNYFDYLNLQAYPYWEANVKNRDLEWVQLFENDHLGLIDFGQNFALSPEFTEWMKAWQTQNGTQFITHHFQDKNVKTDYEKFCLALRTSPNLMQLELTYFDTVQLELFRNTYGYNGLFVVNAKSGAINHQLKGGCDFLVVQMPENFSNPIPFESWKVPADKRADFEKSTQRILRVKNQLKFGELSKGIKEQKASVQLNLAAQSVCILKNASNKIPIQSGATLYGVEKLQLNSQIREENKLKTVVKSLNDILKITSQEGVKLVFLPDSLTKDQLIQIKDIKKDRNLIFCFSNPSLYPTLKNTPNLVYYDAALIQNDDYSLFVQLLTNQLNCDGNFVFGDSLITGIPSAKTKLARTSPGFCGLSADTLKQIDYAVNAALHGKAFPGCQVLIAKNGCIVYDKSFGYFTYDRQTPVNAESMYDVASLTKVVATTMVGMLLYEQNAYELLDSLKDYLPDSLKNYLPYPSTIRNLTFQELFTHQSGMPAGFPIIQYMQYTSSDVGRFDKYYCDKPDSIFTIEVAENFYLEEAYRDSMWVKLNKIWLDPSKDYKYSDVNMNTLYFMFKSMLQNDPAKYGYNLKKNEQRTRDLFVEFLYDKLYKPLGMNHTRYKPLREYPKAQIVPTENERFWRKQLLQGYVHDPNAALYGGIGGNAGIFSTTNDLAILCDLLLQKGSYNGQRYFKPETVEKFTNVQPNTFRGLGFNKPSLNTSAFGCADSAPQATFGHTGFTGTCFWVDPVNKLTFVFLSNRVYPEVNNRIYQFGIRRRVHQLAYDAALFLN